MRNYCAARARSLFYKLQKLVAFNELQVFTLVILNGLLGKKLMKVNTLQHWYLKFEYTVRKTQ